MAESNVTDIMLKLIQRKELLDEKLAATLVSSLHDKDGALTE